MKSKRNPCKCRQTGGLRPQKDTPVVRLLSRYILFGRFDISNRRWTNTSGVYAPCIMPCKHGMAFILSWRDRRFHEKLRSPENIYSASKYSSHGLMTLFVRFWKIWYNVYKYTVQMNSGYNFATASACFWWCQSETWMREEGDTLLWYIVVSEISFKRNCSAALSRRLNGIQ